MGLTAGAVVLLAALAGLAPPVAPAAAPNPSPSVAPVAVPAATPAPPPAPVCCLITANTPILVQLTNEVSSYTAKKGDTFALSLAEPIMQDGKVLVPAGAPGGGEVVDAAHANLGGKPGKLVLAARYIEYGGVRLPLRAFRLGGGGRNNSDVVLGVDLAIGIVSVLIPGGEMKYPAGLKAVAKIAADVTLPPAPPAVSAPDSRPASPASNAPAERPAQ
ncbi:MAG TPA: hypothetical protein VGI79_17395 [Caulobacteraceae bacterium]|jgi:hypothetical protein